MFSRAAKSVVRNFGRKNCHASENRLKNARTLVLTVEKRSRVPGILNPLVEQTAEKPVLNEATTLEQNGLVHFATKNNEKFKNTTTNDDTALTPGRVPSKARRILNSYDSNLPLGISKQLKTPGAGMCSRYQDGMFASKSVRFEPTSDSGGRKKSTDDYFPIGEEYEDELGPGWSDKSERIPAQKSSNDDASGLSRKERDSEYFLPEWIFKNYSKDNNTIRRKKDFIVKNTSDNEAHEKLETLQKKVEEFKRKLFRLRGDGNETRQLDSATSTVNQEPEKKDGSKDNSTTREQNIEETRDELISTNPQPNESYNKFLRLTEAGGSCEVAKVRSLLSLLTPSRDIQRRYYAKRGDSSKPDCSTPKKTPDCTSPKTPSTSPCAPDKVRFRECPPPPKLPKLPKCPPPCPPPPPPPVPKCPKPPKCPPPCAPPQKSPESSKSPPPCKPPKQKCSSHNKMLTYGLNHDYKLENRTVPSRLFHQSYPVFLVTRRRFSSLFARNFASNCKSGKKDDNQSSKGCKKSKETKKNCPSKKSTKNNCEKPKKSATDSCVKPKKPATDHCLKPKKQPTKVAKRDCKKAAKNCSTKCSPKPRCAPLPPPPPRSQTRVEWTPPICPPPRLVKPPPCPELSKQSGHAQAETSGSTCPPPPPLPKPPCRPVCLCPCPPPPKLPPSSCPDVPTVDEPNNPSCPPPCPPKLPAPCPKDTWCPSKPICPSKK